MKPLSVLSAIAASVLFAGALAGCSTRQSGAASGMGHRPTPGRLSMGAIMGDEQAMCELDRRMLAADSAAERQAMVDRYMAGMSPETRRQRLQMMREQCE